MKALLGSDEQRTMGIPFTTHPRRVVALPGEERALVVVRRDWPKLRWSNWGTPMDYVDYVIRLRWLLRRRGPWLVEYYLRVGEDLGIPHQAATGAWQLASRVAACAFAEQVAGALAGGNAVTDGDGARQVMPRAAR